MSSHLYMAFGLTIASELACPELAPSSAGPGADVTVRVGKVSMRLDGAGETVSGVQVAESAVQIEVPRVARYRVVDARDIVVDPLPGATPADIRLFLLGTVFGALLHLRGRPPLHASTVLIGGRAVAFCGHSGSGKSTLAAALHGRGHPLLSDDTGVIIPDERDRPVYHPGVPRIRLWRDALDHFGIATEGLIRDSSRADKFHLHPPRETHGGPSVLARIYLLDSPPGGDLATIEAIDARERIPRLMATIYRPDLARILGTMANQFRHCTWIVDNVPLRLFCRPWSLDQLDPAIDRLEADLRREAA